MLLVTGVAQAVLTVGLLINAMSDRPQVWIIYVVGGLLSIAYALQRPSRDALLPRVVRHEELPAAVALSSLSSQIGMLIGPAIGGLIVGTAGVSAAFTIDVVGLALATVLYALLRAYPPNEHSQAPSLAAIKEGLQYAVRRRDLLGTYLVDMVGMFMAMPIVLYPAFATDVLDEPAALGLLYSAGAAGSLIATVSSGWTSRVNHHGQAIVLATMLWGASIAVAGLAPNVWFAVAFLALAGGADMISGIFRSVVWNQTIPDEMRGRLAGIEMLSYSIGPLGGQARSGLVADLTGVRTSIVSGGILCVVGVAATAAWLKEFWRYDARTDEHAVRERTLRTGTPLAQRSDA
jgi:MFS family permease